MHNVKSRKHQKPREVQGKSAKKPIPPAPPVRRRGIRLKSSHDVRRFLARIANELYRGELEERVVGRLAYVSSVMLTALEASTLEERVRHLEESLAERERLQPGAGLRRVGPS